MESTETGVKVKVCKTFIHRFDSGPRLQTQTPNNSIAYGQKLSLETDHQGVGQKRRSKGENNRTRRSSVVGQKSDTLPAAVFASADPDSSRHSCHGYTRAWSRPEVRA